MRSVYDEHEPFHSIETCRERLKRYVGYRLDRRLSSRVDPSDIVQETFIDASRHLSEFSDLPDDEVYRRLKQVAIGRAIDACRRHLAAQRRSVLREYSGSERGARPGNGQFVDTLAGTASSVSGKLSRREELERVRLALEALSPADRELLLLRHILQLEVGELAELMNTTRTAITTRHLRAIQRLRRLLGVPSKG